MARRRRQPRASDLAMPLAQYLRRRRLRSLWAVLVLIGLLAIVWIDRQGVLLHKGSDWDRYHLQTFTVLRVVDGDTLELDEPDGQHATTRIRFWGVDTPEKAHATRKTPAEPFAEEATAFTRSLCENVQVQLDLESHQQRDVYNRLLAYVLLPDGRCLNEELIAAGLARADRRFSHRWSDRYKLLEQQAKHDRKGIWSKK